MFEKLLRICMCLIVLVLVLAFFNGAEAAEKYPLKVGVNTDLSGPLAALGRETEAAVKLAVDEINAKGGIDGHMIEVVVRDDGTNASKATSSAIKLCTKDNVLATVGGVSSSATLAALRVTGQHNVPTITTNAMAMGITDPANPWFPYSFRVQQNNLLCVDVLARYIAKAGYKRPGVSYVVHAYGFDGRDLITKVLKTKYGIDVVAAEGNEPSATDLTAQALKLKAANPDVIVSWDYPVTSGVFVKALEKIGWNVVYSGAPILVQSSYIETAGDARVGSISVDGYTIEKPGVRGFFEKLKKRLGAEWPETYIPINAYDGMNLLGYALDKANVSGDPKKLSEERRSIREAIESIDRYDRQLGGQIGSYLSFSPTKHEGWNVDFPVLVRWERVSGQIKKVLFKY